jgi:propionyl-CoA carboxylase alpha chain
VLGDSHGNVVYLHERECSIQRRHQKVIEEAPSPFISDATRQAMGAQAVALAKAVKYQSAGTVEFVVGKDQSFYFPGNEHAAAGGAPGDREHHRHRPGGADDPRRCGRAAALHAGRHSAPRLGHRMPHQRRRPVPQLPALHRPPGALPAAGQTMEAAMPVPAGGGVRVDTGVYEGGEIPMYYDSMIAKLIVHGADRNDAIAKMREALNGFVIRGVSSNIPFQAALLAHPKFVSGDFNTGFIAEHYAQGLPCRGRAARRPRLPGGAGGRRLPPLPGPRRRHQRPAGRPRRGHRQRVRGCGQGRGRAHRHVPVKVEAKAQHHRHRGRQGLRHHRDWRFGGIRAQGNCNGEPFTAQVERHGLWLRVEHNGRRIDAQVMSARAAELLRVMPFKAPADMSKFLLSPMPGLLVDVAVKPGQVVQAGERLAVIEAMKMENILTATRRHGGQGLLAKPRARAWPSINPS